jgi:hypothetical protein
MKKFLAISDLHVGSAFALFPQGFSGSTGAECQLNSGQEYLLSCYMHMLRQIPDDLDGIFMLGDMVDGGNPKSGARYLTEVDPAYQADAAVELLRPLVDKLVPGGLILGLSGSGYHGGVVGEYEELLYRHFNAKRDSFDRAARDWVRLPLDDNDTVVVDLHHVQGRSTTTIRPIYNEINSALLGYARRRQLPPEYYVVIRAHNHEGFEMYQSSYALGVSLPPFKLQDHFAATRTDPNRIRPINIGAVLLNVDLSTPEQPVAVTPYIYPDLDLRIEEPMV